MAVYNVTAYGATGNGSTDDTAAINSTIAACGSGTTAGVVYFPAGEYKITSTLLVANKLSGCILKGDGAGATRIKRSHLTADAVRFTNCFQSGIEDIAIEGDLTLGNPTDGFAVRFDGGSYISHAKGLYIKNCHNGIGVISCTETNISQVVVRWIYGTYGIYFAGAAPVGDSDFTAYGMSLEDVVTDALGVDGQLSTGLTMDSYAHSLTVRRSAFLQGGVGFAMRDTLALENGDSRPKWAELFDLQCDHNQHGGAWLLGGEGFYLANGWLGSCAAGNGLTVGSAFAGEVAVTNSRIGYNGQFGVLMAAGPVDCLFSNSFINGNSQLNPGACHGIYVAPSQRQVVINGCRVGNELSTPASQGWGIFVDSNAADYVITGNILKGNILGGLADAGIAPKAVANNI
jgi:hypothetical protein